MRRILRIVGIVVAVIVVLLLIAVGYVFSASNAKLNTTHEYNVVSFDIPDDEETLAEGERIFLSRGCGECHTADGGGNPEFLNDPALGYIPASNITKGAGGFAYSADDYVRAIQHGVGHDGRGLIIMPSQDFAQMREAELVPLVAYLLQLEPIDREAESSAKMGPVGRALITFGALPLSVDIIDHETAGFSDIEAEPSVEYGAYLAGMCAGCHGVNNGGQAVPGGGGFAPNITSHADGIGDWTFEEFQTAIQTGVRPEGEVLDALLMPWPSFAHMNDVEVEAVYNYLQSIEPVAGN